MRIAVVGATGQTGRLLIERLHKLGGQAVAVSRSGKSVEGAVDAAAADVVTGAGLDAALEGCDVLVDVVNTQKLVDLRVFSLGARNQIAAAERVGIKRAVMLSAVGVEQSQYPYHRKKAEQERLYRESSLDTTIVRATEYHSFITSFFENGSAMGAIPVFLGARFQPVAPEEVADLLATTVMNDLGDSEIAGPRVWVSRDLAKAWQQSSRARGLIVNGPFPPKLLEFFRSGANLSDTALQGAVSFQEWLQRQSRHS